MFSTLPNTNLKFSIMSILLSANAFNFNQFKCFRFVKSKTLCNKLIVPFCSLKLSFYQATTFLDLSKIINSLEGICNKSLVCHNFLLFPWFSIVSFPLRVSKIWNPFVKVSLYMYHVILPNFFSAFIE